MPTSILVLCSLLILNLSFGQCQYSNETSELGIGMVEYDPFNHRTLVLQVFDDPELKERFTSWNIRDESNPAPFCAKFHKPDYGIVQLIVLDSVRDSYRVLINESDIKYVPRSIDHVFRSWRDYLLQSHGIRRKMETEEWKDQPVRSAPNESAEVIKLSKERFELFCVLDFDGDWVKVKYDCFHNESENPYEGQPCSDYIGKCTDSAVGWLKWKEGNRITVDIFLMA